MRVLRWLAALLLLPMFAVVSLEVSASAAPAATTRYISNRGAVGLGVIRTWKGEGNKYAAGMYDTVLTVGHRTDLNLMWPSVDGFYIGTWYCAHLRYVENGRWKNYGDLPFGQWQVPRYPVATDVQRWEVNSYYCGP
jgi:hypothetical protein